jgi:hypothetical protein
MRKVYFWKWAFESGMVEARGAPSARGPRIFGIPRWWYRAMVATGVHCFVRSLLLRDDAFDCQRELCHALGWIWGLVRGAIHDGNRSRSRRGAQ